MILSAAYLLSCTITQGKTEGSAATGAESLRGSKFFLKYQAFASHDKDGTETDTVSHEGDYIQFAKNGKAYLYFKGKYDAIGYNFTAKDSLSFGDTPFLIKNLGGGFFSLYQNEVSANGDYNRVTYLLKKAEDQEWSFSK